MIFNLQNPYEHQAFKEKVNDLYQRRKVVEVKVISPTRSMAQNRYLFLLLGYFGLKKGYTTEEVKEIFFKRTCNADIFEKEVIDKFTGEVHKVMRSTAELSTAEMTKAIDKFRNWSAMVADEYLPDANEKGFLLRCQQEIERNNEYLAIK